MAKVAATVELVGRMVVAAMQEASWEVEAAAAAAMAPVGWKAVAVPLVAMVETVVSSPEPRRSLLRAPTNSATPLPGPLHDAHVASRRQTDTFGEINFS